MTIEYVNVEEAIRRNGLRMVVVSGLPSPWGEAAKGIFHIKKIDWVAVRLVYDSESLAKWAGQQSGPIAIYDDEEPLSGWAEISELAERLAPTPRLIPEDSAERDEVLALAKELLGKDGLAWSRRLHMIDAGIKKEGGFPERVAQYLGNKYGFSAEDGAAPGQRVVDLLDKLTSMLKKQERAGSPYYFGDSVTVADVYSATCMALFAPLPPEQCDMNPRSRETFSKVDRRTQTALDPILLNHREMMYKTYLQLPLSL